MKKLILLSLMATSLGLTAAQSATHSNKGQILAPHHSTPSAVTLSAAAEVPPPAEAKEKKEEKKAEITTPREGRVNNTLLTFVNGISTEPTLDHEAHIEKLKKETEDLLQREVVLDTLSPGKAIKDFMTETVNLIKERNRKFLLPNPHQTSLTSITLSGHTDIVELIKSLSIDQTTALQAACASKLEFQSIRNGIVSTLDTLTPFIKQVIDNEKKHASQYEGWISRASAHFSIIAPDGATSYINSQPIHDALADEMKAIPRAKKTPGGASGSSHTETKGKIENQVLVKIELIFADGTSANDYLSYAGRNALFASGETPSHYTHVAHFNGSTTFSDTDRRKILPELAIFTGIKDLFKTAAKLTTFITPPILKPNAPTPLRQFGPLFETFSTTYYHSEQFLSLFIQRPKLALLSTPIEKILKANDNKPPVAMILHVHSLRDICDQCSIGLAGLLQYLRQTYPYPVMLCASSQEPHTTKRRAAATEKRDKAGSFFSNPIEIYLNKAMHDRQSPFYVQLFRNDT